MSSSAGCPYRCTAITARVRGEIAASTPAGSIQEAMFFRFHRHGRRAGLADRKPGRDEGVRGYDHLVAGTNVQRTQDQVQRIEPVGHAGHGARGNNGKLGLETFHSGPSTYLPLCATRSTAASMSDFWAR